MPTIAILIAESAISDLEAIRAWYMELGAPAVGDRLVREMVASIESLADHPDLGRIVPEFGQPFLRELIRPPFRIVYRREPERVRVIRIWRSERPLEESGPDSARD
jgi:toxin ParE1/3/4